MAARLPIVDAAPPADPSRRCSPRAVWAPKLEAARARLRALDAALVCFSAGVDSTLVLALAVEELGPRALALTADSETLPDDERRAAVELARQLGARHRFVRSHELQRDGYRSNPVNRCFFCKTELYELAGAVAVEEGIRHVLDGVNVDDLGDHRPGLQAAEQHRVEHLLVDAGLDKADVRGAARALGLPNWDKPAFACLASRLPYGTEVTVERLERVGGLERLLRERGLRQVRVRWASEDEARVEVLPFDLPRLVEEPLRGDLLAAGRAAGFRRVSIDLAGYRRGALNEGVVP